jgi:KaiC/GvpD/RAD55 family RecA-like ATPase
MEIEDYTEAEKYFKESNTTWENAGSTDSQLTSMYPALSKLYLKKGEIGKAEELIEKTYEYVTKTRNKAAMSDAEMLKGMLFREKKNWEQSIQHFEKSLQGYKSMNAQKWYVRPFAELLYEYGLAYLGRNEEGDKEKAYALLDQAVEIYRKIDARKKVEKIRSRMILEETAYKTVPKSEPTAEISEGAPGHIATGYADLDRLIYGGIPQNYAVILTSPSCGERDLLVKSFLETGAKKGEVTFYVTMDPGAAKLLAQEFQSNFCLFVCNPQADAIIRSAPNVFKLKGVENLTDISIALTSAIRKLDSSQKGPRRICIGLISDVLLQHRAVQTRRWLTSLVAELKSMGFTTLATINPQMHPSEELQAILDLFEGEINIYEKETENGAEKYLKIRKMSNHKYLENELFLKKEGYM